MLRRKMKMIARVVGFVVLFIFFVITTQLGSHSYNSVLTIRNVAGDGARLNIDRSLFLLDAQTQHRLLNASNNRLRPASARNTTMNMERGNYNAKPKNGKSCPHSTVSTHDRTSLTFLIYGTIPYSRVFFFTEYMSERRFYNFGSNVFQS